MSAKLTLVDVDFTDENVDFYSTKMYNFIHERKLGRTQSHLGSASPPALPARAEPTHRESQSSEN